MLIKVTNFEVEVHTINNYYCYGVLWSFFDNVLKIAGLSSKWSATELGTTSPLNWAESKITDTYFASHPKTWNTTPQRKLS